MDRSREFVQWNIDNPGNYNFRHLIDKEDWDDSVQGLKDMLSWENEARVQSAAAGEIRMKLAEHLEDIRNNISSLRQQAQTETNDMSIALIQWKIAQLQKEECWIEGLLFGKAQKPAFYADNDTAQPGLMPAM